MEPEYASTVQSANTHQMKILFRVALPVLMSVTLATITLLTAKVVKSTTILMELFALPALQVHI